MNAAATTGPAILVAKHARALPQLVGDARNARRGLFR